MTSASNTGWDLDRWFDPALAVVFLIAFEVEVLTSSHRRGALVLNVLVVAVISLVAIWRRRAPLVYASVVMALGVVMSATLTDLTSLVVPLYVLFVPAYTVAAYEPRDRALIGLAICVAGAWSVTATASGHSGISDFTFTAGMAAASWAAGRALRARRQLNTELEAKARRIEGERESRERLAVADERSRIARELHAVVAGSVSSMIVQTEVAERLLDEDLDSADDSMAAVEAAGRETLAEMRRILGVLRHADDIAELAPQPGVGQIHLLVESARDSGREVELDVEGEPGPLPASVDLGVYRILEEALETAAPGALDVRLAFTARDVELSISGASGESDWPTLAMRERVALCDGELAADDQTLQVRLPRAFDGVPA